MATWSGRNADAKAPCFLKLRMLANLILYSTRLHSIVSNVSTYMRPSIIFGASTGSNPKGPKYQDRGTLRETRR